LNRRGGKKPAILEQLNDRGESGLKRTAGGLTSCTNTHCVFSFKSRIPFPGAVFRSTDPLRQARFAA